MEHPSTHQGQHGARPANQRRFGHRAAQHLVLLGLGLLAAQVAAPARADSGLLDSVKNNPQLARSLCSQLRQFNAQGLTANDPRVLAQVGSQQGLNGTDSEILTTYVVGLYCPDVR